MSSITANSLGVVIVEKSAVLRPLTIKNYCHAELYKKCGYKQENGFVVRAKWSAMLDGNKIYVHLYGKTDGRAGNENKFEFPPPADTMLLFGTCLLLANIQNSDGEYIATNLSIETWTKINEGLFGELENVEPSKKTKTTGYLKDGFVVDSDADTTSDTISNNSDFAGDNSSDCELDFEEYV